MIRGVIWKASPHSKAAEELFDQLIDNYRLKGHTVKVFKSKYSMRFSVDNGDFWEAVSAHESFRAKRCNISYIERGVPRDFVNDVIVHCTTAYPFRAITYFGEYGLIGDDYECLITA